MRSILHPPRQTCCHKSIHDETSATLVQCCTFWLRGIWTVKPRELNYKAGHLGISGEPPERTYLRHHLSTNCRTHGQAATS